MKYRIELHQLGRSVYGEYENGDDFPLCVFIGDEASADAEEYVAWKSGRLSQGEDIADLVEKLITATIKLYMLKEEQARSAHLESVSGELLQRDIDLCRLRANLKNRLNATLGGPKDVKDYGGVTEP